MSDIEPPIMNQSENIQPYQSPILGTPEYVAMTRKKDIDQLRLLSIFYYVLTGFAVMGLLFLILHACIMGAVFTMAERDVASHQSNDSLVSERVIKENGSDKLGNREGVDGEAVLNSSDTEIVDETVEQEFNFESTPSSHRRNSMSKQEMGTFIVIMVVVYVIVGVMIITMAILNFMCARRISRQRSRTFCMIVAGANCLQIPFGLALGIFTFVVLGRQSVVELFAETESGSDAKG